MPTIESMNSIWKRNFLSAVIMVMFLGQLPASAGYEYKYDKRINPMGNFESEIAQKFTRGITNTLFGWTELAKTPIDMAQGPKKNFFKVILIGIPYGALKAVGRTAVGVFEMVTCVAPQKPILPPIEGDVE